MLYQIFNNCLEIIKNSNEFKNHADFTPLAETSTHEDAIKAMQALVNKIRTQPSFNYTSKDDWELHHDYLMLSEKQTLQELSSMFEEIKTTIKKEFKTPELTHTYTETNNNITFTEQNFEISFAPMNKHKAVENPSHLNAVEQLYMFYLQVENYYTQYNNSSSSSSNSSSLSDQIKTDEQKIKYMNRVVHTVSQVVEPFLETTTFESFMNIKKNLENEKIENSMPLLFKLGSILAATFQLPPPRAVALEAATAAPAKLMSYNYLNQDLLAPYTSLYAEYLEIEDLLSLIPAANGYHQGSLAKQDFKNADVMLETLLNYAKKLDLSFLHGFMDESLYKRLDSHLANVKALDEKAKREQLYVAISAFSLNFAQLLKSIGAQFSFKK